MFPIMSLRKSLFVILLAAGLSTSLAARADDGKVVWDYWYTVSVNKIPAEMYNEKFVMHDDKIQYMQHVWKKEEGYMNEEQLGAFSKADENLTPLFFNFRSTYRTTETVIDGTVKNGKNLVVKIRKGTDALPSVSKSVPTGTFFSVFFPVWLRKAQPTLKEGKTVSFGTILEDDVENGFSTESGLVRLEKPDDFAQSSGTKKLAVDYLNSRTYWYIDSQGSPVKTVRPDGNMVIERVSKDKAEAFLK